MIRFSKLKLNGFKSFIDRGELDIAVGLTGIVGPNGCGKSNLVEALRWVMGESSARKMRGSGMDDVIFNGTERRPSRNFAEVTLVLDNQTREAPAPYNQHDDIEISRRINRDKGSIYRINGKTSRARDVQMLFADTMTGANSPSLVSQGRVAEIINAKPQDRRHVLEESAGVAGLYARRHEAELRLKAAETNLTRLDDISESMSSRIDTLKRQARQAERYKELNAEIRKLERQIAYVEWHQSKNQQQNALRIYDAAEALVADKMKNVTSLTNQTNETKRDLPKLRDEHIKLTSALHSQSMALSRLEDEEKKIKSLLKDSAENLKRAEDDLNYETKTLDDNKQQLLKVESEEKTLHAHLENETDILKPLEEQKATSAAEVKALEKRHEAELEALLSATAKIESLNRESLQLNTQRERIIQKQQTLKDTLNALKEEQKALPNLKEQEALIAKENAAIGALSKAIDKCAQDEDKLNTEKDSVSTQSREIQQQISGLKAEEKTLQSFLSAFDDETVLDEIHAKSGYEIALSRALGDTLLASTDTNMDKVWTGKNTFAPLTLPDNCKPLSDYVDAPPELSAALNAIGVVTDFEAGETLAPKLQSGQSLVSPDGYLWRWDGYHMKAEAADQLATHLKYKNRLQSLTEELTALDKKQTDVEEKLADYINAIESNKQSKAENAQQLATKQREIRGLENTLDQTAYKIKSISDKITMNTEAANDISAEQTQLEALMSEKQQALNDAKENAEADQQTQIETLKEELSEARLVHQSACIELDKQIQEQNRRKARIHAIADERNALKNRTIRGAEQLKKLASLLDTLKQRIENNKDKPARISEEKEKFLSARGDIEEECNKASDRLAKAEMSSSDSEKQLKAAESELATAREDRAAAQANVQNAEQHLTALKENIQNNYQCAPNTLLNKAEYALNLDDSAQDIPQTFKRLRADKDTATIKREKIGPVNLQASDELKEIDGELTSILKEKEDLVLAIDELRKAINTLNAEARARLIATFEEVNNHFKALFKQLYRGGEAYLQLVDSDDALDAGIEIFAQPPGKTLQSLSLMSGGEQTLASIALIFAMFLTNPSPICVLDEVDAPLDDANVDRVCDLLDEIAAHGHTRFLVITHHRLTMARMDRLYGVTMAEQGVSQLVSVDLQQELDFLDDAA